MKQKIVENRSVDDSCLFCGKHPANGGHYFKGILNKEGNIEVDSKLTGTKGWLVIEHIANCYVWVCPKHRKN